MASEVLTISTLYNDHVFQENWNFLTPLKVFHRDVPSQHRQSAGMDKSRPFGPFEADHDEGVERFEVLTRRQGRYQTTCSGT